MFGEESSQKLGTSAGKVVKEGIGAVRKIGNSLARHTDQAASNLFKKGSKKGGSRKNMNSKKTNMMGGSRKNNTMKKRGGSRRSRRAGTCRRGGC
jgi:hypothetical protein